MIFSSSSTSSSSYGRRARRPSCPCSVRPCPILPLLIPHKGSSFKLLWEGGERRRARREGERARETESVGSEGDGGMGRERDRPRNEAHVTELGRGSRWRRGRNSILKSRDLESHSTSAPKSPLPPRNGLRRKEELPLLPSPTLPSAHPLGGKGKNAAVLQERPPRRRRPTEGEGGGTIARERGRGEQGRTRTTNDNREREGHPSRPSVPLRPRRSALTTVRSDVRPSV